LRPGEPGQGGEGERVGVSRMVLPPTLNSARGVRGEDGGPVDSAVWTIRLPVQQLLDQRDLEIELPGPACLGHESS
jgi:hypothetical protein